MGNFSRHLAIFSSHTDYQLYCKAENEEKRPGMARLKTFSIGYKMIFLIFDFAVHLAVKLRGLKQLMARGQSLQIANYQPLMTTEPKIQF